MKKQTLWLSGLALAVTVLFAWSALNMQAVVAQTDATPTPAEGMDQTAMSPEGDMTPMEGELTATPMDSMEATPVEGAPEATPMEDQPGTSNENVMVTTLGDITDNSEAYYGQRVAFEGEISDLLNVDIAVLAQPEFLGAAEVLVVNNSGQDFPVTFIQGQRARVVEIVHPSLNNANMAEPGTAGNGALIVQPTAAEDTPLDMTPAATPAEDMNAEGTPMATPMEGAPTPLPQGDMTTPASLGLPGFFPQGLTADMLDNYRDHTIVELTSVDDIGFSATIGDLTADSARYVDQPLYVKGEVGEAVTSDSFVLSEGALIGNDSLLVFNASGQPLPALNGGETIRLYGTVQPFDLASAEAQTGQSFDDAAFQDYQDYTTFYAQRIAVVQQVGQ